MPKISRDDIDRFFEHGINLSTKTIYMDSMVDEILAEYMIKSLHILEYHKPKEPITIIMNNYGGAELDGLGVYDYINRLKQCTDVYIEIYGNCMSMAAWILQAATVRRMSENSRLMVHVGYMGLAENHPEINKRWMAQYTKDEVVFENILLEKIQEKQPKYTQKKVKDLIRFDSIFTPEEALDLGLIDEIID